MATLSNRNLKIGLLISGLVAIMILAFGHTLTSFITPYLGGVPVCDVGFNKNCLTVNPGALWLTFGLWLSSLLICAGAVSILLWRWIKKIP